MHRVLRFSTEAKNQLAQIQQTPALKGVLKQVHKALGYLQTNPEHPSLNTHEFLSLSTKDYKVFEAYAQNNAPGAYRIFWRYGPDDIGAKQKRIPVITVFAIAAHG